MDKLIAEVEAGWCPGYGFHPDTIDTKHWSTLQAAFNGSLDAAHRLHTALLPGWNVQRLFGPYMNDPQWRMTIKQMALHGPEVSALAPTPARAWLLAILRATAASRATVDTQTGGADV